MSMTGGIPIDCGSETRIRRYREDDLEALLLQADHPQVAATLRDAFPHPYTRQDAEQWIALATGECSGTNFVIESGGAFAGGIGLMLTDAERRITAEIGYWIGPDFWGRGIVTDAVSGFVPWVFDTCPEVLRIEAPVYHVNPASARVLEKNGFHHEATLSRSVRKGDRILDQLMYVRFRGE
jgi:ribosomal-protein-alanine N-acetyltransferase